LPTIVLRQAPQRARRAGNDLVDRAFLGLHPDPRLDPPNVEQILHQLGHAAHDGLNVDHLFGLFAGQGAEAGQQLGAGLDRLQRRAQVVRDGRDKLGLDLVQLFQGADILHHHHLAHAGDGRFAGVKGAPIGQRDLGVALALFHRVLPQAEQGVVLDHLGERAGRGRPGPVEERLARRGIKDQDALLGVRDNDRVVGAVQDGLLHRALAAHPRKEARVLDRHGHLGRQGLEQVLVVGGKGAHLGAAHVEHAHHTPALAALCGAVLAVLAACRHVQRHGQLAACFGQIKERLVARVLLHVGDTDRAPFAHDLCEEALCVCLCRGQRDRRQDRGPVEVVDAGGKDQLIILDQADGDVVAVQGDQDQARDLPEQLVDVEHGADLVADRVDQAQVHGAALRLFDQARVLNGGSHLVGHGRERHQQREGKATGLAVRQGHQAVHLGATVQGDQECGAHVAQATVG